MDRVRTRLVVVLGATVMVFAMIIGPASAEGGTFDGTAVVYDRSTVERNWLGGPILTDYIRVDNF